MHSMRLRHKCLWYRWFVIGNDSNLSSNWKQLLSIFFSFLLWIQNNSDQSTKDQHNRNVAESQISTQIIALLEHYKQKDPVGIPGNFIADPLPGKSTVKFQKKREENSFLFRFFLIWRTPVPDSKQSLPMASILRTTDALAYGLSKFRIKNIALDVYQMLVRTLFAYRILLKFWFIFLLFSPILEKVKAEIEFDEVRVIGNYTLSSLFSTTRGPFFVTLTHIVATGNASIGVELDGIIRTQNILMDINFANLTMDFQNLGRKKPWPEFWSYVFLRKKMMIFLFWQVWWEISSKESSTIHQIQYSIQWNRICCKMHMEKCELKSIQI